MRTDFSLSDAGSRHKLQKFSLLY